jgi:hypothetical protein
MLDLALLRKLACQRREQAPGLVHVVSAEGSTHGGDAAGQALRAFGLGPLSGCRLLLGQPPVQGSSRRCVLSAAKTLSGWVLRLGGRRLARTECRTHACSAERFDKAIGDVFP